MTDPTVPTPNPTNLQRVRYAVRGVLILGMAASVAANVLHADPNAISKVIAAWPPVALLLAIELVSHVPADDRWWVAWGRRIGTLLIASIAAYVSYWHMAGVAERYGESGLSVFLLPLSVDGLIAVASICLVEISGRLRAETAPEVGIHVIDPAGQGVGRWTPAMVIESAPEVEVRDGHDHPPSVTTPKPKREKPRTYPPLRPVEATDTPPVSVADAVRAAVAVHGHNLGAVLAAVRETHEGASEETVKRNLRHRSPNRPRTNGQVAVDA